MTEFFNIHNHSIRAAFTCVGAALTRLEVRDRYGEFRDVVLGYDDEESYEKGREYFGAIVGRCINRIAPTDFYWNGKRITLSEDENGMHLHGGKSGIAFKRWEVVKQDETSICFKTFSPDGESGYPGNVVFFVEYRLDDNALVVNIKAESDEMTPVNPAFHPYFNLSGHDRGDISDHMLFIDADYFTDTQDDELMLRGNFEINRFTDEDFRTTKKIGLTTADRNYILNRHGKAVARLYSETSGICMDVICTQPCMQLYTAGELDHETGKNGAVYTAGSAVCLEAQFMPNFPNVESAEKSYADINHPFDQTVKYIFGIKEQA